jgi:hypothetical protein
MSDDNAGVNWPGIVELKTREADKLRQKLEAAERELLAITDALGYVNRAEGQGGYERIDGHVLARKLREMRDECDAIREMALEEAAQVADREAHDSRAWTAENVMAHAISKAIRALATPSKPEPKEGQP